MKKIITLILVGCVLASFVGCSQSATKVTKNLDKEVTIQFMHRYSDSHEQRIKDLVEEFEKQNPNIKVEPVYVEGSYEGIIEKLQLLGTTDMLPEVTMSGLQYNNFMVNNFNVANISDLMEIDKIDTSKYFESMLKFGLDADGNIVALPFAVSTPVMYVNTQAVVDAGLDPNEMPESMEDAEAMAKIITEKLSIDGIHYAYETSGNWIIQAMVNTRGGKLVVDGKMNLDSPEVIAVAEQLGRLVNEDKTMTMMGSSVEVAKAFMSGKVGIAIGSSAYGPFIQANSPLEFKTIEFPTFEGNREVPAGGNSLYILTEDPDKLRASWEWVQFLTSPEAAVMVTKGLGYLSPNKQAVETPEFLGDYLNENDHTKITYAQAEDMVAWTNMPGDTGTRINDIIDNAIDSVLLGEKTAEDAMKQANEEANALIK